MNLHMESDLLQELRELARRHALRKVILFGSRARGDYDRSSDSDLGLSGGNRAAFAVDVEEQTRTLLKYDVVDLDGTVQEELREAIQREGIVIYEKV